MTKKMLFQIGARREPCAERGIAEENAIAAGALEYDEVQITLSLYQHGAGDADLGDLVEIDLVANCAPPISIISSNSPRKSPTTRRQTSSNR
jgi:hypothetical protein